MSNWDNGKQPKNNPENHVLDGTNKVAKDAPLRVEGSRRRQRPWSDIEFDHSNGSGDVRRPRLSHHQEISPNVRRHRISQNNEFAIGKQQQVAKVAERRFFNQDKSNVIQKTIHLNWNPKHLVPFDSDSESMNTDSEYDSSDSEFGSDSGSDSDSSMEDNVQIEQMALSPDNNDVEEEEGFIQNVYVRAQEMVRLLSASNEILLIQEIYRFIELFDWDTQLATQTDRTSFTRIPDSLCERLFRPLNLIESAILFHQSLRPDPTGVFRMITRNVFRSRLFVLWSENQYQGCRLLHPEYNSRILFRQLGPYVSKFESLQSSNPNQVDFATAIGQLSQVRSIEVYDKYSVALCFDLADQLGSKLTSIKATNLFLRSERFTKIIHDNLGKFGKLKELKLNCHLQHYIDPGIILPNLQSLQLHLLSNRELHQLCRISSRYGQQLRILELLLFLNSSDMSEPWILFDALEQFKCLHKLSLHFYMVSPEMSRNWQRSMMEHAKLLPNIKVFALTLFPQSLSNDITTVDVNNQLNCNSLINMFLTNLPNVTRFFLNVNTKNPIEPLKLVGNVSGLPGPQQLPAIDYLSINQFEHRNPNSNLRIGSCSFSTTVRTLSLRNLATCRSLEYCVLFPSLETLHLHFDLITDQSRLDLLPPIDQYLAMILLRLPRLRMLHIEGYPCGAQSLPFTIGELKQRASGNGQLIFVLRTQWMLDDDDRPIYSQELNGAPNNLHVY